jgi:hypothetical protein
MANPEQTETYMSEYRQLPVVAEGQVHPYYTELVTVANVGKHVVSAVQTTFEGVE